MPRNAIHQRSQGQQIAELRETAIGMAAASRMSMWKSKLSGVKRELVLRLSGYLKGAIDNSFKEAVKADLDSLSRISSKISRAISGKLCRGS